MAQSDVKLTQVKPLLRFRLFKLQFELNKIVREGGKEILDKILEEEKEKEESCETLLK